MSKILYFVSHQSCLLLLVLAPLGRCHSLSLRGKHMKTSLGLYTNQCLM